MRIGVISDVYGNLPALEAAWAWLSGEGAELVVCLGDLVGYGALPEETVCFVRDHGIETVQGNWDRAVARGRESAGDAFDNPYWRKLAGESLQWTRSRLSTGSIDYLRNLPGEVRYSIERSSILCVHGQPGNVSGRIEHDAGNEIFDMLLARSHCNVLLSGNTGTAALAVRRDGCLINPGSVGGGTYPSQASAAVIDSGGPGSIPVWWQRIPYDFDRYAALYTESGLPEIFLRCIRTGRDPRGNWHTDKTYWRQQWAVL